MADAKQQKNEEIQTHYFLGKTKFQEKNFEDALPHLETFSKERARFADVWFMIGSIQHSRGRFSEAIGAFEKALQINPRYMEAALNLAVTYNDVGQYEKGTKTYQMAIDAAKEGGRGQLDPLVLSKLANLHADLGDFYRSIDHPQDAVEQYAKAVELRPQYVDIQTKLGMALREAGDLNASVQQLKRAVEVNGRYAPARINLGVSLYAQGDYPGAAKVWQEVLDKNPDNKEARLYKTMADKKLGKK